MDYQGQIAGETASETKSLPHKCVVEGFAVVKGTSKGRGGDNKANENQK